MLELPTYGIGGNDYESGCYLYTRGDMRIYWSVAARQYMQQQGIASAAVTIEAEVEGRNVGTYNVSLATDGWLDISEIVLSLGVGGGLDGGDSGACGSPHPGDYEWPPVPSPYNLLYRRMLLKFTQLGQSIEHLVELLMTIDTPPYDGVAPIIDKYGTVRVLDTLDYDCASGRRVVKQVGDHWEAAGAGHGEACVYQWTSLYGSGLYGRSCECWGEVNCADECEPPHCPSPYDCQGVLQGGGECQPKTKKRMVQIRYCNVDALTIERWCEVASERIEATQSERQEAMAYRELTNEWTPRTSGWHTRTRNLTKHYITVAWRGYPVEELKRIADGITYTPTCIIIDGDKAWYAVLADSVDIDIEEGGDLEIEFEVRECDRPVYESCNLKQCSQGCQEECFVDPITGECICPS